jgi:hypothetical protein
MALSGHADFAVETFSYPETCNLERESTLDCEVKSRTDSFLFRLWLLASVVWIDFIFTLAYQQTFTQHPVPIDVYISYATSAFAPICGIFAILFISG